MYKSPATQYQNMNIGITIHWCLCLCRYCHCQCIESSEFIVWGHSSSHLCYYGGAVLATLEGEG